MTDCQHLLKNIHVHGLLIPTAERVLIRKSSACRGTGLGNSQVLHSHANDLFCERDDPTYSSLLCPSSNTQKSTFLPKRSRRIWVWLELITPLYRQFILERSNHKCKTNCLQKGEVDVDSQLACMWFLFVYLLLPPFISECNT